MKQSKSAQKEKYTFKERILKFFEPFPLNTAFILISQLVFLTTLEVKTTYPIFEFNGRINHLILFVISLVVLKFRRSGRSSFYLYWIFLLSSVILCINIVATRTYCCPWLLLFVLPVELLVKYSRTKKDSRFYGLDYLFAFFIMLLICLFFLCVRDFESTGTVGIGGSNADIEDIDTRKEECEKMRYEQEEFKEWLIANDFQVVYSHLDEWETIYTLKGRYKGSPNIIYILEYSHNPYDYHCKLEASSEVSAVDFFWNIVMYDRYLDEFDELERSKLEEMYLFEEIIESNQ